MKKTAAVIMILAILVTLFTGVSFAAPAPTAGPEGSAEDGIMVTVETDTINKLLFTVLDAATREPIEGAVIKTVPENIDSVAVAVTNGEGQAGVKLPDPPDAAGKQYVFVVTKVGYYDSEEIGITYTGTFIDKEVLLYRGDNLVYVDFTVTNDAAQPVDGALVTVAPKAQGQARSMPVTAHTNAKGQVTMQLAQGEYTYTLTHETHKDKIGEISISKNKRHNVSEVMQRNKYDVNLYVADMRGVPVKDAVVTIEGQAVRTDAIGHAALRDLYAGDYAYKITKQGYAQTEGILHIPGDGDDIKLILADIPPAPTPTKTPVPTETPTPAPSGDVTPAPGESIALIASPSGTRIQETVVPMKSAPPIDVAIKVTYTNGQAAANLPLELHSRIYYGRTNSEGWEIFKSVEPGMHTVYVKDDNGNILASSEFELAYDQATDLQIGEDGTVRVVARVGIANVIVEVEIDENTGEATVVAVREATDTNLPRGIAGVNGTELNVSKKIMGMDVWMWAMILGIVILGIVILALLILRKKKEEDQAGQKLSAQEAGEDNG